MVFTEKKLPLFLLLVHLLPFFNHEGPQKSSHLLCSVNSEIASRPSGKQVHCPRVFSSDRDSFEFSEVTLIFIHSSSSPRLRVCSCVCMHMYMCVGTHTQCVHMFAYTLQELDHIQGREGS